MEMIFCITCQTLDHCRGLKLWNGPVEVPAAVVCSCFRSAFNDWKNLIDIQRFNHGTSRDIEDHTKWKNDNSF